MSKTLKEHLKDPIDSLDELIVGFNLKEIKEEFSFVTKENWKERELDDKYWSEKVEELRNKISNLKGQVKSAIDRKNWWKKRCKNDVSFGNTKGGLDE